MLGRQLPTGRAKPAWTASAIVPAQTLVPEDFQRPLEIIRAEHDRQSAVSDLLDGLVERDHIEAVIESADALIDYLTADLSLHSQDEESDLVPMLGLRCRQVDGVDQIMAHLDQEHSVENFLVRHIVLDIKEVVQGNKARRQRALFNDLRNFADVQRKHLDWENRVVLPLAGMHLTPYDLVHMGRNMANRRGVRYRE